MTFGEAISDGFSKYATFSGRSSRSAYWWWILFYVLIFIGALIIDAAIGTTQVVADLAWLAFFLPNLAVLVRRLHDTDHTGWWVLIGLIPLAGAIVLIVFACTDSGAPNKYGNGPDGQGDMTAISPLGQTLPPPPPPVPQGPPPNGMPPPSESERAPD